MMIRAPLQPKDADGILRVICLGRVSTLQQDTQNITASHRYAEDWLRRVYEGQVQLENLGGGK